MAAFIATVMFLNMLSLIKLRENSRGSTVFPQFFLGFFHQIVNKSISEYKK